MPEPVPNHDDRRGRFLMQKIMPRDCRPIDNAIDPYTGKRCTLFVRDRTMDITGKKGMGATLELAHTVRFTVRNPTAVYRGLVDSEDEAGDDTLIIYVSIPPAAYDWKTGKEVSAWKDEVFLVLVNEDGIYLRSEWDSADEGNPKLPRDALRFMEKLL